MRITLRELRRELRPATVPETIHLHRGQFAADRTVVYQLVDGVNTIADLAYYGASGPYCPAVWITTVGRIHAELPSREDAVTYLAGMLRRHLGGGVTATVTPPPGKCVQVVRCCGQVIRRLQAGEGWAVCGWCGVPGVDTSRHQCGSCGHYTAGERLETLAIVECRQCGSIHTHTTGHVEG